MKVGWKKSLASPSAQYAEHKGRLFYVSSNMLLSVPHWCVEVNFSIVPWVLVQY